MIDPAPFQSAASFVEAIKNLMDATAKLCKDYANRRVGPTERFSVPVPGAEEASDLGKSLGEKAKEAKAIHDGLEEWVKQLPKFQVALKESKKLLSGFKNTLEAAVPRQEAIDRMLKELPKQLQAFNVRAMEVVDTLTTIMAKSQQLHEISSALRSAGQQVAMAGKNWPEVNSIVRGLARLLKGFQANISQFAEQKQAVEQTRGYYLQLAENARLSLRSIEEQLTTGLVEHDKSLLAIEHEMTITQPVLAVYANTALLVVWIARALCWLLAAIAALHSLAIISKRDQPKNMEAAMV